MPTALAAGQLVDDRYALDHELHEDELGTTWQAFDRGLGRAVRLREVAFPGEGPHQERLRQALRTARTAIKLDAPGALHVYDAFLDGDRLVVVSELSEARALQSLVARKPLPEKRVAAIALDLLDPLAAAHTLGIIHGGLDPWAVLVPDRARAQLHGFGLAPPFTEALDLEVAEALCAPPALAPEQAALAGTTPATDIWSLGATLYYAVEGEHAYGAPGERSGGPAPTALRARRLGPLLDSMLAADPERRPSIDDLRLGFSEVAGIPPGGAEAPAPSGRLSRLSRRRAVSPPDTGDTGDTGDTVGTGEAGDSAGSDPAGDPVEGSAAAPSATEEAAPERDWEAVVSQGASPDRWLEWDPEGAGSDLDQEPAALAAPAASTAEPVVTDDEGPPEPETSPAEPASEASPEEPDEEPEPPRYRSTPSWPPPPRRRPMVALLSAWVLVVMVALLISNGRIGRPRADARSGSGRPELTVDASAVPGDWIAYRHSAVPVGVSHPPGWRVREDGPLVEISDPATGAVLRIDTRTPSGTEPQTRLLEAERNFSMRHPDHYQRLQMSAARYQGHDAGLWEYTFVEQGQTVHAAELALATKRYSVVMLFQAPDRAWQDLLPSFRGFLNSIRPPG